MRTKGGGHAQLLLQRRMHRLVLPLIDFVLHVGVSGQSFLRQGPFRGRDSNRMLASEEIHASFPCESRHCVISQFSWPLTSSRKLSAVIRARAPTRRKTEEFGAEVDDQISAQRDCGFHLVLL